MFCRGSGLNFGKILVPVPDTDNICQFSKDKQIAPNLAFSLSEAPYFPESLLFLLHFMLGPDPNPVPLRQKSYGSSDSNSGSTKLIFTLFSLLAVPLTDLSRTTTLTRFLMMRLKASLAEEQKFVLWKMQHIKGVLGI